jgi:hypothetical protein
MRAFYNMSNERWKLQAKSCEFYTHEWARTSKQMIAPVFENQKQFIIKINVLF